MLIYSDKSDWIGKPIQVGERIMEIADPSMIQLKVNLPIDDAIVLQTGAELEVFLDSDPLNPIKAIVSSASYTVETSNQDTLSYRLYARFNENQKQDKLRIGLQGTAKVYGDRVSLFFYLFRRPISTLRQFLGI